MAERSPLRRGREAGTLNQTESRQGLQKTAGWVHLWALGVGGVISGNFFGWQTGLLTGGFGGLLLATVVIAAMYVCLVFSIAELSAAMPYAGGFYNFTRTAFGRDRAFLNGLTDAIEYVTTPAVIVAGIAGYMKALAPVTPEWVWWVAFYCIFVGINVKGAALTFRVSMAITGLAAAVLVFFYGSAVLTGSFHWSNALNVAPEPGGSAFLPKGWYGVFAALPYAVWFYLAIEQLPLSAEESYDAERDMPRALKWGIGSLLALSLCTLLLNSGVGPGAAGVGASNAPLEVGFRAVFRGNVATALLSVISLTGLVASFHSIIYAYGRLLYALSRSGYLPALLGRVGRWRTPDSALIFGGGLGLGLCFMAQRYSGSVGAALLNMAVFGALLSYILVLVSFLRLRAVQPQLRRPYRSPLGTAGATVGIVLALTCLAATFAVPSFRPGVMGTVAFIAVMLAYYWLYRRRHMEAYERSISTTEPA
ncbi:MAG: amino acid permease [Acidobacteria bacterium]|nr:amino acid permease [Acidobacteriota bacterium]